MGTGKTELAQQLARRLGGRSVFEPTLDNPFISDFYRDPGSYALPTQMFFLMSRFKQTQALAQGDLFDRMVVADFMFERDALYAERVLELKELEIYRRMYDVLAPQVPSPDLVVHLTADQETIQRRLRARGRAFEAQIEPRYLSGLARAYRDLFERYPECPVIQLDTTHLDLQRSGPEIDGLVDSIERGRSSIPSGLPTRGSLALPGLL